jgi:hypothetical protein
MSSEKQWKRAVFKWNAPKGFIAIVLFFAIALLIEYLMVYFFTLSGLTDKFLFKFFTINISPLFHLMPLGVIVVLVSSWTYLTRNIAIVPHRTSPAKKMPETRRRQYLKGTRKTHFKALRSFFRRIGKRFGRVGKAIKTFFRRIGGAFLRIRGVSYLQKRLFFARTAIKSAVTVLLVFLVSVLTLYLLAYPELTYSLATGIYKADPSFHGFVLKSIDIGKTMAQALSPVGWLASAIDNALRAAAPGFRNALEGFGEPVKEHLAKSGLLWVYILCQNVAAWVSAIVALAYGEYISRLYRVRKSR